MVCPNQTINNSYIRHVNISFPPSVSVPNLKTLQNKQNHKQIHTVSGILSLGCLTKSSKSILQRLLAALRKQVVGFRECLKCFHASFPIISLLCYLPFFIHGKITARNTFATVSSIFEKCHSFQARSFITPSKQTHTMLLIQNSIKLMFETSYCQ